MATAFPFEERRARPVQAFLVPCLHPHLFDFVTVMIRYVSTSNYLDLMSITALVGPTLPAPTFMSFSLLKLFVFWYVNLPPPWLDVLGQPLQFLKCIFMYQSPPYILELRRRSTPADRYLDPSPSQPRGTWTSSYHDSIVSVVNRMCPLCFVHTHIPVFYSCLQPLQTRTRGF